MKCEDEITLGIADYLKAEAAAIDPEPCAIIAVGDPVPEVGPRVYVMTSYEPIHKGELFRCFADLTVETPAQSDGAVLAQRAAVAFLAACFPVDQSKKAALTATVETATDDQVRVNFYHPEAIPEDPSGPKLLSRTRRMKIQCEEI
jgi:hypothetical protein